MTKKRGPGQPSLGGKGKTPQFPLRLSPDARKRYQQWADVEGVSLAKWIRLACERRANESAAMLEHLKSVTT